MLHYYTIPNSLDSLKTQNTGPTPKPGTVLKHFPLMSCLIGSHAWCKCLLFVYLAPVWEISHHAITWTWAWWVHSAVSKPGPHLSLICLASENNNDVICNLAPCVKYGEWDLAFISRIPFPNSFRRNFWLLVSLHIPGDSPLEIGGILSPPQKNPGPVSACISPFLPSSTWNVTCFYFSSRMFHVATRWQTTSWCD